MLAIELIGNKHATCAIKEFDKIKVKYFKLPKVENIKKFLLNFFFKSSRVSISGVSESPVTK